MQVRVEGKVQTLSGAESDSYFHRYNLPQAASGTPSAAELVCTAMNVLHGFGLQSDDARHSAPDILITICSFCRTHCS